VVERALAVGSTGSDRRKEAEAIVEVVSSLQDDVVKFPKDLDAAKRQLALQGLDAALSRPLGYGLTREQFVAAVLVGRGMTFVDAAKALEIPEGVLHQWSRMVPQFRAEIKRWREALEDDIEARLYSTVAEMMASVDDYGPTDQIRLMALAQKIAERPEDRARWAAEFRLRQETLELQKQELQRGEKDERDPRIVEGIEQASEDIWEATVETEGDPPEDELL